MAKTVAQVAELERQLIQQREDRLPRQELTVQGEEEHLEERAVHPDQFSTSV